MEERLQHGEKKDRKNRSREREGREGMCTSGKIKTIPLFCMQGVRGKITRGGGLFAVFLIAMQTQEVC